MKQFWNGWSYPKMMPEIIEAVETHFCDEKDIIIDCMLYLKNATARVEDLNTINKWFDDNNRCHICGCELETVTTKEPHFELGPDVYENLVDYYCPNCAGLIDERR